MVSISWPARESREAKLGDNVQASDELDELDDLEELDEILCASHVADGEEKVVEESEVRIYDSKTRDCQAFGSK